MPFDLTSLEKSIRALEKSIAAAQSDNNAFNDDIKETLRAGVIRNFETAYEQCWKFIQRWIRENRSPEEADYLRTRKDLFRTAARYGLIFDPEPWFDYGDAQNLISHTYDEEQADTVFQTAQRFLPHASDLLIRLKEVND
ncbi:nucleotidyltransferase substrate binding protein [bacterium]|nr:nucleotidyltransferase substrate binding protein [FCB group bacterium]MBL7190678.1 nucleotidyltransferase substrate binding protein [bacterium]